MLPKYDKKYRCTTVKSQKESETHNQIRGSVCYLAYLKVGEHGWFLFETDFDRITPVHRIRTSEITEIVYTDNSVIVYTENTHYEFEVIE